MNSLVYTNSNLSKPLESLELITNATASAVQGMVVVRGKDDKVGKSNETAEGDVSTKKLSKKVKEFLKDCRLENFSQQLLEEGEKVKSSPHHTAIISQIIEVLKPEFSSVQVYAFGSRISGLGSDSSDLDLYVDLSKFINVYLSTSTANKFNVFHFDFRFQLF